MKLEDALLVDVKDLEGPGVKVECCLEAACFPILKRLAKESRVNVVSSVELELLLQADDDLVRADGSLKTAVRLVCSRCLEEFSYGIDLSMELVFQSAAAMAEIREEELELTAGQIELIPFKGSLIDLRDPVAEQIILALPMKPLCGSSCRGLCPHCGENLNYGPCKCPPAEPRGPFAGLKVLLKTNGLSQEER